MKILGTTRAMMRCRWCIIAVEQFNLVGKSDRVSRATIAFFVDGEDLRSSLFGENELGVGSSRAMMALSMAYTCG